MTDEKIEEISNRYIELFENITGQKFEKADNTHILERIERNVLHYLKA
jgi:phosphoribosylaminoimidazole-succinocarboxamide synthase